MKQLPKKLYHVSLDITHSGVFDSRVPESRMQDEDSVTPRICVSDSIEGCLTASGFGAHYLGENLFENNDLLKVFIFDTEKLGLTSDDVIFPEELYQSGKVDDANLTNEHWVLTSVSIPAEDQYVVKVTGFDDSRWDFFFSYKERLQLEKRNVNFNDYEALQDAYFDLTGDEFPSFCIIEDVSYELVNN